MSKALSQILNQTSAVVFAAFLILGLARTACAQLDVGDSNVGYIDSAIPANGVRLRYDAAFDANFPNRSEFFWPTSLFGGPGPTTAESRVDYQDVALYIEATPDKLFSVFVELPVRFLNPVRNENTAGLADINAGIKRVLCSTESAVATFQLRAYSPTADEGRGLGTGHVSLEPALLVFQRLTDRFSLEGEFRDWIPIDGTDHFDGNILRYGVGVGYLACSTPAVSVTPVAEVVGWTVLDGLKSNANTPVTSADNDTIVNLKLGLRLRMGPNAVTIGSDDSLYIGFGRALTGDVWYEDIVRVEYRTTF